MNKGISIVIVHNAVNAVIKSGATDEVKSIINELLSYQQDGAEFTEAFKSGRWDGRSSFFNYKSASFPRGFVMYVVAHLRKLGHKVDILKKKLPEPLGKLGYLPEGYKPDPRYWYQDETAKLLLTYGQMIAQLSTGAGKTLVSLKAVSAINRPTLFLTTRGVLMYQAEKQFKKMGKKTAILGDGSLQLSNEVTCATTQTIASWIKDPDPEKMVVGGNKWNAQLERQKKMKEVLERFELVILEEAHEVSGNSFFEIMKHCKNAHYRLALTATPFMKEEQEANMRLMSSSGHIGIKVTEKQLIDCGILAKPYFKFVDLKEHPKHLYNSTSYQRAVELGIVQNEYRNQHILKEVYRAKSYGLTSMVLVSRKEHGEVLKALFEQNGIKASFIQGENNRDERQEALNLLGKKSIDVLIGTSLLDVGVDVPSVGLIILAGGGKAEVALRQRIGRGLREKKDGSPNVALVVDFVDGGNKYLREHARQRRGIIMNTDGFKENVVVDFDFQKLGFKKVEKV